MIVSCDILSMLSDNVFFKLILVKFIIMQLKIDTIERETRRIIRNYFKYLQQHVCHGKDLICVFKHLNLNAIKTVLGIFGEIEMKISVKMGSKRCGNVSPVPFVKRYISSDKLC